MMKAPMNQVVGYVAPPARPGGQTTIKQAIVLESFNDGTARLDITDYADDGKPKNAKETAQHHTAIAAYDPDKKAENSWHLLEEAPQQIGAATPAKKAATA